MPLSQMYEMATTLSVAAFGSPHSGTPAESHPEKDSLKNGRLV